VLRPVLAVACLVWAMALSGCHEAAEGESLARRQDPALRLAISSSLADLARPSSGLWGPGVAVTVSSDESALDSLAMGYVDAAVVWGPLPELVEGLSVEAIASDALAFVVHPSNQTGPLQVEDLRGLFTGRIGAWDAFGQSVGSVVPVMREKGAGTRSLLESLVLKGELPASGAPIAAADGAVLDYVSANPGAVGYVAAANLREGVRALTIEERRPEPQRVREGEYPLMGGVWFAYRSAPEAAALLERLVSDDGRGLLGRWLAAAEWAPR